MKKSYKLALAAAPVVALAIGAYLAVAPSTANWQFVVEAEARTVGGEVLAAQQVVADTCTDDGQGYCVIGWEWGELPGDVYEWVKPYFVSEGHTVPVAYVPDWCGVDPVFCKSELSCDGEAVIVGPSDECLAQLAGECGLEPDADGFWYVGTPDESNHFAFAEPMQLAEWWESCPVPEPTPTVGTPPPTYTPACTYTPEPTPTCRPTWTPFTATPYPTSTPEPTSTPWPTQPPF